jgi:hypothetical protein
MARARAHMCVHVCDVCVYMRIHADDSIQQQIEHSKEYENTSFLIFFYKNLTRCFKIFSILNHMQNELLQYGVAI